MGRRWLVNEGDTITIDVGARTIEVEADLDARRAAFKAPDQSSITGAIGKYVRLVRSHLKVLLHLTDVPNIIRPSWR